MAEETSVTGSLKCKTWVLKVFIHCEGCRRKVKKSLQRLQGVYEVTVDPQQSKVTVAGNIGSETLLNKLLSIGKHAEILAENPSGKSNLKENSAQLSNLPPKYGPCAAVGNTKIELHTKKPSVLDTVSSNQTNITPQGKSVAKFGKEWNERMAMANNKATGPRIQSLGGVKNFSQKSEGQHGNFTNNCGSKGFMNGQLGKNHWANHNQTVHLNPARGWPQPITANHTGLGAKMSLPTVSTHSCEMARSNSVRGYDFYHQYIPSQPSAYSDIAPQPETHCRGPLPVSNGNSLDMFSEENPSGCTIL